jgi:hypothetical protein
LQPKPGNELEAFLLADPNRKLRIESLGEYDTVVRVPSSAPDASDSVIVLDTRGGLKTHPGRLLSKEIVNRLLAFDAQSAGKGLKYGDGKAAAYYVSGFKKPGNSLVWKVRLNEPAEFAVSVKYNTSSGQQGGDYEVKFGGQTVDCRLDAIRSAKDIRTIEVGKVKLPAGETELRFQPKADAGDVQLFEIDLAPGL